MGTEDVSVKKFLNVSAIVVGVIIASFGELDFVLVGFLFQIGGIVFEAIRINLVSSLLHGQAKMDPLVSMYYFAPVCAIMNFTIALVWEVPTMKLEEIYAVGLWTFFANACVAFLLNVSLVFLVSQIHQQSSLGTNSSLDWKNLRPDTHNLRCIEGYFACWPVHNYLGHFALAPSGLRLLHRSWWNALLQDLTRSKKGALWQWNSCLG